MATATREPREHSSQDFWEFTKTIAKQSDRDRIVQIHIGHPATTVRVMRKTFDLAAEHVHQLLNVSASTIERRERNDQLLDPVASERLDRIAEIAALARDVFEDEATAVRWLRTPNAALGGERPLMLCRTELGSKQVRRVLHALEWGGAV